VGCSSAAWQPPAGTQLNQPQRSAPKCPTLSRLCTTYLLSRKNPRTLLGNALNKKINPRTLLGNALNKKINPRTLLGNALNIQQLAPNSTSLRAAPKSITPSRLCTT
jgi:hypothetical protein